MSKYGGRVDNTPPPGLDDDVANCLKFLIAHQQEWKPSFYMAHIHEEHPMTLIPVAKIEKPSNALP